LIRFSAASDFDVVKDGSGVKPAGFRNAANLQPLQDADIESLGCGHGDNLLRID
jgi:hypothetical protein